jgi:putative DNA primase/helicase
MAAAGVDPGGTPIIADGGIHRFIGPHDRRGEKNSWYVKFGDRAGAFGSWKLGFKEKWYGQRLSAKDRVEVNRQIQAAQAQAEAKRTVLQEVAARRAERILKRARQAISPEDHPYLLTKQIEPHGTCILGNLLVVPLHDVASGRLQTVQFIAPDGTKKLLKYGRKTGCYRPIGKPAADEVTQLGLAEGLATAATLNEILNMPIAMAVDCHNLSSVAKALRKKYRHADIFVFADDDRESPNNPGVTKARETAVEVGGRLIVPIGFTLDSRGTDFNDLVAEIGADAVREQILKTINSGIPRNFRLTKEALHALIKIKVAKETKVIEVPVSSHLEVVASTRDEKRGNWGKLLSFDDADGNPHEWAMPMEMLADDGVAYRRNLLERGLRVEPTAQARQLLNEYLTKCQPLARAGAVTRIGWHDQIYVLPDRVFGATNDERVLYQNELALEHTFNTRGSLEEWRREVAARCSGNSRLLLAVSAAFAAALLYQTGDESGGLHFVGFSSIGKSTTLRAAGSVWGGSPTQHGYLRSWRSTANGLEGIATLHSDALLCIDEIGEVDAREAGQIAYMLANGQGKARARRDGSARPPQLWRVLFLSSGEMTLGDKVREDNRQRVTGGMMVRVLDIPADAGAGMGLLEDIHGESSAQAFADQLRAATDSYYGTAAPAFLTELVKDPAKAIDTVRKARDKFMKQHCPAGADGQVRRAATRFALVGAAGELAILFGVTSWKANAAITAATTCFQDWLKARGHLGPAEIEAGIEQVRMFFIMHAATRLGRERAPDLTLADSAVQNRAGFSRADSFCIYPEIFRNEIARGFDWRAISNALAERNALQRDFENKTTCSIWDPVSKKNIRMFVFNKSIVGDEAAQSHQTMNGATPPTNQTAASGCSS